MRESGEWDVRVEIVGGSDGMDHGLGNRTPI